VLCSLADAVDHLIVAGVTPRRVQLIGGGARSAAIRAVAPGILGTDVLVPAAAEYVALGAARQAAWALAQTAEPPPWPAPRAAVYQADPVPQVREKYAALRDATAP
jgi:xylulokinase